MGHLFHSELSNYQIDYIYIYYISYIIYDHHPSSYSWKGKSEKYGTMIQNQQLETEMGDFALPSFASWLWLLNRTWPSLFSDCHYQLTIPQGLLRVWAQYPRPTRSVEISVASIWAKVVQCGAFTPVQQLKPAKPSSTGEMSLHFYCPCALTWHQQISVAQIPVKKTAVSHDDPWIVLITVYTSKNVTTSRALCPSFSRHPIRTHLGHLATKNQPCRSYNKNHLGYPQIIHFSRIFYYKPSSYWVRPF